MHVPNSFAQPDPAMVRIEHTPTDPYELRHAFLDNFSVWSVKGRPPSSEERRVR